MWWTVQERIATRQGDFWRHVRDCPSYKAAVVKAMCVALDNGGACNVRIVSPEGAVIVLGELPALKGGA